MKIEDFQKAKLIHEEQETLRETSEELVLLITRMCDVPEDSDETAVRFLTTVRELMVGVVKDTERGFRERLDIKFKNI